jgi:hypothetical protein
MNTQELDTNLRGGGMKAELQNDRPWPRLYFRAAPALRTSGPVSGVISCLREGQRECEEYLSPFCRASFIQRFDCGTRRKQMPNRLHSAKVAATGGCNGLIRSNDGLLDLKLALPPAAS